MKFFRGKGGKVVMIFVLCMFVGSSLISMIGQGF